MDHLTDSLLNELLDDALPEARRRAAEAHLAGCPTCRFRLEALRLLAGSLAALADEPLARDLTPAVLSALPAKRRALAWRLAWGAEAGLAIGLVALAVRHSGPIVRDLLDAAVLSLPHLPARWPRLPALQLPSLSLPAIHLPQVSLAGLDLASPHLILLAAAAAALFVVGNSILLGNAARPHLPRRNRK